MEIMKKIVLLLMLVLLTSCEGYQAVVYSYGVRQRPEPRPKPRRVYHYYTPYTYNPVVTPVYIYPSNPHHHHHIPGRRR